MQAQSNAPPLRTQAEGKITLCNDHSLLTLRHTNARAQVTIVGDGLPSLRRQIPSENSAMLEPVIKSAIHGGCTKELYGQRARHRGYVSRSDLDFAEEIKVAYSFDRVIGPELTAIEAKLPQIHVGIVSSKRSVGAVLLIIFSPPASAALSSHSRYHWCEHDLHCSVSRSRASVRPVLFAARSGHAGGLFLSILCLLGHILPHLTRPGLLLVRDTPRLFSALSDSVYIPRPLGLPMDPFKVISFYQNTTPSRSSFLPPRSGRRC